MVEEQVSKLTPDQAGAFVAQWAETHKVSAEELAAMLGVDESTKSSLLRQSKGRLSMEKWLHDKQPKKPMWQGTVVAAVAAAILGGGVGAYITGYMMPAAEPEPVEKPISVSSSLPNSQVGSLGGPQPVLIGNGSGAAAEINIRQRQGRNAPVAAPVRTGTGGGLRGLSPQSVTAPPQVQQLIANKEKSEIAPPLAKPHEGYTDITSQLGMDLPYDLSITIVTPRVSFRASGTASNNYIKAEQIKDIDVRKGIYSALGYLYKRGDSKSGTPSGGGLTDVQTIIVRVGTAMASQQLDWSHDKLSLTEALVEDQGSRLYSGLSTSLLSQIKAAGKMLFPIKADPTFGG